MKMKKLVSSIMVVSVMAATIAGMQPAERASAAGQNVMRTDMPIEILYNARKIATDVAPKVVNGSVLVPIRFVSDKLGGKLTLSGKNISIVKGNSTIDLTIGSAAAKVNGKSVTLPVAVIAEGGRTLVPLRVISEGLDVPVEWDAVVQFVWIGNKEIPQLADIIKPVDISPYAPLYKGKEFLMENAMGKNYTLATIVNKQDFPFKVSNGVIFYRMDLAYTTGGEQYIKATTTDKGVYATPTYFLSKGSKPRTRPADSSYNESIGKDIRLHYYSVVSAGDLDKINDLNYKNFKLNSIDYIGMQVPSESAVLIKNIWK